MIEEYLDPAARARKAGVRPTRIVIDGSMLSGTNWWMAEERDGLREVTLFLPPQLHAAALKLFPGIPIEVAHGG